MPNPTYDWQAFCDFCQLGTLDCPPVSISGGLLHTMLRLDAGGQRYALKKLNPVIMRRPAALGNMRTSEQIARALSPFVPVAAAMTQNGDPIINWAGEQFLLFPWQEGHACFPPEISPQHCRIIGEILGRIHTAAVTIPNFLPHLDVAEPEDWPGLLRLSKGQPYYEELAALLPACIHWEQAALSAQRTPQTSPVLTHRDLDPKNVLWQDLSPYLIDWEAAGYRDPDQDLLTLLRDWACDMNGRLQPAHARALLSAYRPYRSTRNTDWAFVLDAGYADLLGWLAYSIRRAAGIEAAEPEELALGARQASETIQTIRRIAAESEHYLALLREE